MKKTMTALLVLMLAAGCSSAAATSVSQHSGSPGQSFGQSFDTTQYSTDKLHFEHFDTYYRLIGQFGLPEDIVREPLGNANGVWKYSLRFNDGSSGSLFNEIGYAEMAVHNNDSPPVMIVLHPRLASDGYEVLEESDEETGYEPFGGGLDENNSMKLTGNDCVLVLEQFFAYEGREYLTGTLWMSEESSAAFLMVRGQE